MTVDMDDGDALRPRIHTAIHAFTPTQVGQMMRLGVRFWEPRVLEGKFMARELDPGGHGGVRALYIPGARIIRLPPGSGVGHPA